jgi:drug/metabolite transporter (DMT)-like permease
MKLQVGVAGMFVMGGGYFPGTIPQTLGALAVLLATINVSGGFILTKRMLDMFKRKWNNDHFRPPFSLASQVHLILRSIHGSTLFLPLFSLAVFLLQRAPGWQGLFKQGT